MKSNRVKTIEASSSLLVSLVKPFDPSDQVTYFFLCDISTMIHLSLKAPEWLNDICHHVWVFFLLLHTGLQCFAHVSQQSTSSFQADVGTPASANHTGGYTSHLRRKILQGQRHILLLHSPHHLCNIFSLSSLKPYVCSFTLHHSCFDITNLY